MGHLYSSVQGPVNHTMHSYSAVHARRRFAKHVSIQCRENCRIGCRHLGGLCLSVSLARIYKVSMMLCVALLTPVSFRVQCMHIHSAIFLNHEYYLLRSFCVCVFVRSGVQTPRLPLKQPL